MSKTISKASMDYDSLENSLIKNLMSIGLTKNEAKTYLSLLPLGSAPASDLIKQTGISDSKIYYILDNLQKKGLINLRSEKPKQYTPAPLEEALESFHAEVEEEYRIKNDTLDRLAELLVPLYEEPSETLQLAYIIKGKNNVLNQARRLIRGAKSSLIIMIPNVDIFHSLEDSILEIQEKLSDLDIGIYHDNIPETSPYSQFRLISCECFFVIVDNDLLLTVSNWKHGNWIAIRTSEKTLIEVSSGFFLSSSCCYTADVSGCTCDRH